MRPLSDSSPAPSSPTALGTIDRPTRPWWHTAMDTADSPRPAPRTGPPDRAAAGTPRIPPPPASRRLPPPAAALPISPRLVLRGLARHWWQALALWVVGSAALAALVYLQFEPTYRSFSLLRIDTERGQPLPLRTPRAGWPGAACRPRSS